MVNERPALLYTDEFMPGKASKVDTRDAAGLCCGSRLLSTRPALWVRQVRMSQVAVVQSA